MKKSSDKSHLSLHTQQLSNAHAPLPWARSSKRRRREGPAPPPSPSSGLGLRSIRTCCRSCSRRLFQADPAVNKDASGQSQKMPLFSTVAAIKWPLYNSLSDSLPAVTAKSSLPAVFSVLSQLLCQLSQLNPLHQSSLLFSLSSCASCHSWILYTSRLCCSLSVPVPAVTAESSLPVVFAAHPRLLRAVTDESSLPVVFAVLSQLMCQHSWVLSTRRLCCSLSVYVPAVSTNCLYCSPSVAASCHRWILCTSRVAAHSP